MPPEKHDLTGYADAILALAEASGRAPVIESDLEKTLQLLRSSRELRMFLEDPSVSSHGKNNALEEIMSAGVSPMLIHFLRILQEEGKIRFLGEITEIFHRKTAMRARKKAGIVLSAVKLPHETVKRIEQEIGRITGGDVVLRAAEDPDIIGGIMVKVGDMVIDGTVARSLAEIRKSLAS